MIGICSFAVASPNIYGFLQLVPRLYSGLAKAAIICLTIARAAVRWYHSELIAIFSASVRWSASSDNLRYSLRLQSIILYVVAGLGDSQDGAFGALLSTML